MTRGKNCLIPVGSKVLFNGKEIGTVVSDTPTFAEKVLLARTSKGITQHDLSLRCKLTRVQVSNIERGIHMPKLSTAQRIAHFLAFSLNDVRGDYDTRKQTTS